MYLNDNFSSNTNLRYLEECKEEIIMLFRVKFGKELSEVDILSTVVLEAYLVGYWIGYILLCSLHTRLIQS